MSNDEPYYKRKNKQYTKLLTNAKQTKEERRIKYKIAREHGINPDVARRIRDFRKNKFWQYIENWLNELYPFLR